MSNLDNIRNQLKQKAAKTKNAQTWSKPKAAKANTPAGPTNAANPTTLDTLKKSLDRLENAERIGLLPTPREPVPNTLPIEPAYQKMGEAIGSCPYELKILLTSDITTGNELVTELLKKLVTAIKISSEVDLSDIRKRLRDNEKRNQENIKIYQKTLKEVESDNRETMENRKAAEIEVHKNWATILIDLIQKTDRNSDVKSLGEWDRAFVRTLASAAPHAVSLDRGKVFISFELLKLMDAAAIKLAINNIQPMIQREKQENFDRWLCTATAHQLYQRLQTEGYDYDTTFAYAARKGMALHIDQFGDAFLVDDQLVQDGVIEPSQGGYFLDADEVRYRFRDEYEHINRMIRF